MSTTRGVAPAVDSAEAADGGGVGIIAKAVRAIAVLGDQGRVTAAELSAATGEPVSTVYRLLKNLEELGLVERSAERGYFHLGPQTAALGRLVEDSLDLRGMAAQVLRDLQRQSDETVHLCLPRDHYAVCLERLAGGKLQSTDLPLGGSTPLHRGASALVLLAFQPAAQQASYFDFAQGESMIFPADRVEIERRLEEIRGAGLAVTRGDITPGVVMIAAPVFDHRGGLLASISASGVESRVDPKLDHLVELVRSAATRLNAELGYGDAS